MANYIILSSSRFFYHYPVDLTSVLKQRVAYENDNFKNPKLFEKQIKILGKVISANIASTLNNFHSLRAVCTRLGN